MKGGGQGHIEGQSVLLGGLEPSSFDRPSGLLFVLRRNRQQYNRTGFTGSAPGRTRTVAFGFAPARTAGPQPETLCSALLMGFTNRAPGPHRTCAFAFGGRDAIHQ